MKPSLLLISAIPPFPQTSGGATRIYYTIKELSKKYSIFFVTFDSNDNEFYKKYTEKFININLGQKSISAPIPYRFSDWYSDETKLIVNRIIQENKIKNIQIEFTQLLYLIELIPASYKTTFTAHDISTVSFLRRIPESISFLKRIASIFFWIQIFFYEKKFLPKFNRIITVSQTDHQFLKEIFGLPSIVLPNGIEKINFIKKNKKSDTLNLGFIGSFAHPPNKHAINYIVNKLLPLLEQQTIKYRFFLAGNNPFFYHPKVTNMGIIDNVKEFYQNIDYLVAPVFSGSGTRIKILESLSYGIPIITTPIGAEGLNFDNSYLRIANTPSEFIFQLTSKVTLKVNTLQKQLYPYLWQNIFNKSPHSPDTL